ncbi:MAG: hypothetical protein P8M34_12830 [Saprospiraceae bacterium]|nr:hypothetical protein [Saprospiraceae bacterium]|tara:strand:+ start:5591 stop:6427 length:837 start_codon:yes stop_codon:yes gene_type:complete
MKQLSSMSWLTSISVMVLLLFLTLFLVITYHSGVISDNAKRNSKILVELDKSLRDSLRKDVISFIESHDSYDANSLTEYSEEEALLLMKDEIDNLSYDLESNPFSSVLSFTLKTDFHKTEYYQELKNELIEKRGVSFVNIQEIDFAEIDENLKRSNSILLVLFDLFSIFTLFLLFNLIRISLIKDEKKIRTMKLVGAHERFIMMPYLKNSLFIGLLGFIGCVIACITIGGILTQVFNSISALIVHSYMYQIFVIVLLLALILPMISTYMIIRLYLRKL